MRNISKSYSWTSIRLQPLLELVRKSPMRKTHLSAGLYTSLSVSTIWIQLNCYPEAAPKAVRHREEKIVVRILILTQAVTEM